MSFLVHQENISRLFKSRPSPIPLNSTYISVIFFLLLVFHHPRIEEMEGQSRKWMILVASSWIQAFTGTNFDFSSYSSKLKSVLGISQVELNYLSMASDMGKAFGWCSGVSLMYLPLWVVLFIAAFMGFFGYGFQWLLIRHFISLPYFLVFLLCLLAGCSITWFNTVCYVLCIKNFPSTRPLALSLSISFNGVSAALYNLIVNAINPGDPTLYLLLNGLIPLITSIIALVPILRQPPAPRVFSPNALHLDSIIFLYLSILAASTGMYLLIFNSGSSYASIASLIVVGAIFLLILPLVITGTFYAWEWTQRTMSSSLLLTPDSGFNLDIGDDDLEIHKTLMGTEDITASSLFTGNSYFPKDKGSFLLKDVLTVLGEEHSVKLLMSRWDFWLYYMAYFCGGTIGLIYSNNLGQIAQSLGYSSEISQFVSLYSACSFFGRLLSAAPDFLRDKVNYPRTGWLALALIPTPIAFLLLVSSGSKAALNAATALIGLSSGFVSSAAVSITSELFGPNSAGINHNVLITNIPLGSLLCGLLAALLYEANIDDSNQMILADGSKVCIGRKCYSQTFIWWSFISLLGVTSSSLLFLRTRAAYHRVERNKTWMQFS